MTKNEALRMAIGDLVLQKMVSGNDVPVSRCTITATEIQACKEALAETQEPNDLLTYGQSFEKDGKAIPIDQVYYTPKQEPMLIKQENGMVLKLGYEDLPNGTAFYTTPPSREWVGLSDEEIEIINKSINPKLEITKAKIPFARAIEAKLKEKNI